MGLSEAGSDPPGQPPNAPPVAVSSLTGRPRPHAPRQGSPRRAGGPSTTLGSSVRGPGREEPGEFCGERTEVAPSPENDDETTQRRENDVGNDVRQAEDD